MVPPCRREPAARKKVSGLQFSRQAPSAAAARAGAEVGGLNRTRRIRGTWSRVLKPGQLLEARGHGQLVLAHDLAVWADATAISLRIARRGHLPELWPAAVRVQWLLC